MPNAIRLSDLFDLPTQIGGLELPLDDLWNRIGLEDFTQSIELPDFGQGPNLPDPTLPADEAAELEGWFQDELEEILPEVPTPEAPVTPADAIESARRVVNAQLQALSDVEIGLFEGFTVVLNRGGFTAKATLREGGLRVETTQTLSGRFGQNLLRPLRKVTVGGETRYEPDPTKTHVEVELAQVKVVYDSDDGLSYDVSGGITAKQPFTIAGTDLVIDPDNIHLDLDGPEKCLAVQFPKSQIKAWLRGISPALVDQSPTPPGGTAPEDAVTLRVGLNGGGPRDVRVDWFMAENRTLSLPGVKVQTPQGTLFTLLLGYNAADTLDQIALALTFENVAADAGQLENAQNSPTKALWAYSTFAWGRGGEREMHTAENKDEPKLFDLRMVTKAADAAPKRVSLLLVDVDPSGGRSPLFLKQYATPLERPDFANKDTLCAWETPALASLDTNDWKLKFRIDDSQFRLPFLNETEDKPDQNKFSQFIEIDPPDLADLLPDFSRQEIRFALKVTLKFGSIQFASALDVIFNWEKFALAVEHDDGLKLLSPDAQLASEQEHLGLMWRLKGRKDEQSGKYHYFTLVTKDYNYQVQMAQGASFELDYTKISQEPITFIVSDLVLGPKGLNLTAEVSDRPARMNGIDTRFTFHGSRLQVNENRIEAFKLAGSGPLPPDLVGDAMVNIWLAFEQRGGSLTLVKGHAELQSTKLLHCKGSRFQFQVDKIGLSFVNEGAFHLYFTLTGSAQFALAPGDDAQGALALLPKIKIDMVDCPLCGDPAVIAKHVNFLIELPKPKSFNFLGAFEFELRAIGFFPRTTLFADNPPAMQITGQLRFAQGAGDTPDSRHDFHKLFIALPEPGGIFPRLYFKQIAVNLSIGGAFKLQGIVEFKDEATEKGFWGEGMVELQGLPSIAAAFAFLRVRRSEQTAWVRAWFIYLEVRRLSIMIPVIQIYIREIGMGFGYRFTIASIKAVDREKDVKKLLVALDDLSRKQADLANRDRWAVDNDTDDPRWTIVLRALVAQNSASALFLYNESGEKNLANLFLFDAMIAFRSDLTFYMAVRAWFNTNYYTYDENPKGEVKGNPFASGYIVLSPRRKMFLARVVSNKNAYIGDNPPLPGIVKTALKAARFSATLLIEPSLIHFELGWSNNIGWDLTLGPLKASITSGFIFRVSREDLIIGISYRAEGSIDVRITVDLGLIGVRIRAYAYVAWGARLIGRLPFDDPANALIYGNIGLEVRIEISFEFFIRIPLIFTTIEISFKLSLGIGFSAGLEAVLSPDPSNWGVRGTGTLYIMAMGHSIEATLTVAINGDAVKRARDFTAGVLNMGLEAADTRGVPGVDPIQHPQARMAAVRRSAPAPFAALALAKAAPLAAERFDLPEYSIFVIRSADAAQWSYFVLLPKGERRAGEQCVRERGFLPPPPLRAEMRREDWPALLERGVLTAHFRQALADALAGTGWQDDQSLTEVIPVKARERWLLLFPARPLTLTREGESLKLELFDTEAITGSTNFPLVDEFGRPVAWEALSALHRGDVAYFRAVPLAGVEEFANGGIPTESFRLVTRGGRSLLIVSHDGSFRMYLLTAAFAPPDPDAGFPDWRLIVSAAPLATSAVVPAHDSLALDDFSEWLGRAPAALPPTVALALQDAELIDAATPLDAPVQQVEDGQTFWTFSEGENTYRLVQTASQPDVWTVELQVREDFIFHFPPATDIEKRASFQIDQYQPARGRWVELTTQAQQDDASGQSAWKAQWTARLFDGKARKFDVVNGQQLANERGDTISLAEYLAYGFRLARIKNPSSPAISPAYIALADPDEGLLPQVISDDRVRNPGDNSFEAAVRGALEQFEGSPYFKADPERVLYDRLLRDAFDDATTIYTEDGLVPEDDTARADMNETQQARQLRGIVVQDIIGTLQEYVREAERLAGEEGAYLADKIPFQLGLVFRYRGGTPIWLDNLLVAGEAPPTVQQRRTPGSSSTQASAARAADTFNLRAMSFDANPPRFQRIQQYSSSATIAIAWDLEWPTVPQAGCSPAQADPEHHLAHYLVRRRALDGGERDLVYTLKPAHAAHRRKAEQNDRDPDGALMLRSRFQVVDHFTDETPADRASLPPQGRSYLYNITPIDFAGSAGRPLTLIATRRPDQPPAVPLNAELTVVYRLGADDLLPAAVDTLAQPPLAVPERITVTWNEPEETPERPQPPIRDYRLVFRREPTVPLGSYGLDSVTQRAPVGLLPTSSGRPLATDIKIILTDIDTDARTGQRRAAIALAELAAAGVFPAGAPPVWQPDAWQVFFQTVSVNDVPSSLAPVELRLRAVGLDEQSEGTIVEERAPSELEWLARPIAFAPLPPEDERAIPGIAHFPMPRPGQFTFDGDLDGVSYRRHPALIRAVRLRWNQGPSGAPGYPLDLTAGYRLLLLDIDAHTDETFDDDEKLRAVLREIQEIQMLPAEELLLQPSDTLAVSQWEAWYPSSIARLRSAAAMARIRSQNARGPWYSWRESRLEWPFCPEEFIPAGGSAQRKVDIHPFLTSLLRHIGRARPAGERSYRVAQQPLPGMQPNDWETFAENSNAKTDPYGWGVLQRLGLSTAFSVRDEESGELIVGSALLALVQETLTAVADDESGGKTMFPTYYRHLFVELLFQPGKSINLGPVASPDDLPTDSAANGSGGAASDADGLLALVQISLRPVPAQTLKYYRVDINGPAGGEVEIGVMLAVNQNVEMVNAGEVNASPAQLQAAPDGKPIRRTFTLPVGGALPLAFRGEQPPQSVTVRVKLASEPLTPGDLAAKFPWLKYETTTTPAGFFVSIDPTAARPDPLTPQQQADLRAALRKKKASDSDNTAAINTLLTLRAGVLAPFAPTDELSTRFLAPVAKLAAAFAGPASADRNEWLLFWRYARGLNVPDAPQQIVMPVSADDIAALLPSFLEWSQRFFDMGPDVTFDATSGLGTTHVQGALAAPRVWLATAYPRAGTPAYATPDENGRLQYDHLFEDRWAHNFRFYIRPYGRYDLIWNSFSQSIALFPNGLAAEVKQQLLPAAPDPFAGGLDAVLERIQPVDAPLILSSTRLDKPAVPGQPVPPGKTWEVIIAKHPEQTLAERNQTLARQLGFRQVAFTLLRRVTDDDWIGALCRVVINQAAGAPPSYTLATRMVEQTETPDIPHYDAAQPLRPDHIAMDALPPGVDEADPRTHDARSLALPARVGEFQQGALALQWRALPFYYTHRLLVIAQTASTVSPVSQVDQRDFEYVVPTPEGRLAGRKSAFTYPLANGQSLTRQNVPLRAVAIPLRRFWDSLPADAQAEWPEEQPDGSASAETTRKYSSLPDPDVVYQLVELFGGNIEVQVEFFYDPSRPDPNNANSIAPGYSARQLGKRFFGQVSGLLAPQVDGRALHDDFVLQTVVAQVMEEELSRTYAVPDGLRGKVLFVGKLIRILGILTLLERDLLRDAMANDRDRKTIDALYADWYSEEPVSEDRSADLPDALKPDTVNGIERISFLPLDDVKLVWVGPMSAEERAALLALPGDPAFVAGLQALAAAAAAATGPDPVVVSVPRDAEPIPDALAQTTQPVQNDERLALTRETRAGSEVYTALVWRGFLLDDQIEAFDAAASLWAQIPELAAALADLRRQLEARVITRTLPGSPWPLDQADLPAEVQQDLLLPTNAARALRWVDRQAPDDAQLAALTTLVGDPRAYADFGTALQTLLDAWNDDHTGLPLPQPITEPSFPLTIFEAGARRVSLASNPRALVWQGPLIKDSLRKILIGWISFLRAFEELLRRVMQGEINFRIPFAAAALLPPEDELRAVVPELFERDQFIYDEAAREIGWGDGDATPDERDILRKLVGERFADGLVALLAAIDANRSTPLDGPQPYPQQGDLPEPVRAQLVIAAGTLTWTGRLKTQAQYDVLRALARNRQLNPDFRAAVEAILKELQDGTLSAALDLPVRPTQRDLLPPLAAKLLLARWRMRFHGLMVVEEALALRAVFEGLPPDQAAAERLYGQSLKRGMRGRRLTIRARRGSATPSAMLELVTEPLPAQQ